MQSDASIMILESRRFAGNLSIYSVATTGLQSFAGQANNSRPSGTPMSGLSLRPANIWKNGYSAKDIIGLNLILLRECVCEVRSSPAIRRYQGKRIWPRVVTQRDQGVPQHQDCFRQVNSRMHGYKKKGSYENKR